ncbi:MAG: ABC transporter permease [Marinoscillum sp.]
MLRNYFLVGWRNILKHKAFTLINVIGLSLSMSVCLLLILLVYDHYQYDEFHPKADQTYRILSFQEGTRDQILGSAYATSPFPFGKYLKENYPAIESYTNLNHSFRGEIESPFKVFDLERSLYADERFFEVFGFTLKEGLEATALKEAHSIVLTSELSKKLFPKGEALGSLIKHEGSSFKVTGVLAEPKGKSHIKFDALASFATLEARKDTDSELHYNNWTNLWMNYNYIVLSKDTNPSEIAALLNDIGKENIKFDDPDHKRYEFELQNINDVVPGRLCNNEIGFTLPIVVIVFFIILGFIVLLTASINYANLSIAKSLSRSREVGVRKVNGATRWNIMGLFLVESVILAFLSLAVAIGIYKFLINSFNEMWIFNQIGLNLEDSSSAYIFFFVFTLLLGIISGVAPSLYISKINPVKSLKGSMLTASTSARGISRYFSSKKLMMGVQFSLAIVMLVSIFLLRDQAHHLMNSDYGFENDKIVYVDLQGHDPQLIANEFGRIPGVSGISFTTHHPAVGRSHGEAYRLKPEDEDLSISHFGVDNHYLEVMGLQLIAGNNFPEGTVSENEKFIILNQLATERLGFESPAAAIGETILLNEDTQLQIIGVVKDYHWEPMMKGISPLALRIMPDQYEYAYFKMETSEKHHLLTQFKNHWNEFDEARSFEGGFLNEAMNLFYQFMDDLASILTLISVLSIAITCLGFLGMLSFHLKTHVKEIGIRKVLGATFSQILFSMTRGFISMVAITFLIAIPGAVVLNGLWINMMATHAPIGLMNVGPAVVIILIITGLTIISQVWMNSNSNPIEALRSE